jgi:carboxymethylenebutenolidase
MDQRIITLSTPDGEMDAYLVDPGGDAPRPAIVVAQEAFGVNGHIRDMCGRLAAEGYVAIAPELYHRQGRGKVYSYDDYESVRPVLLGLTNDGIEMDVAAALAHLRELPGVTPKRVGIVGFCMGGFVAFLAACRSGVSAAVSFYGGGIVRQRPGAKMTPLLREAESISGPILCMFGAKDASIPIEDVEMIRRRLEELGKASEVVVYPDAGHGFLCDERPSYAASAAADAWRRTLEWFRRSMPPE